MCFELAIELCRACELVVVFEYKDERSHTRALISVINILYTKPWTQFARFGRLPSFRGSGRASLNQLSIKFTIAFGPCPT